MELMQNSSSAGRHGMPVDLLGSDDVIGGSWHSSKSPAHNLDNGNGVTMQTNKGKAKEVLTPVQRSPRRVASAKALENVMRNSAPPSAARTISSPSAAETSSEANGEASTAHAPSSSSPSRVLPLTNAKLAASQRRVQSLSPLPKTHRNGILQHTSSAPFASADDESEGEVSFIDSAEMSQFRFQAAPDCATSILTRPAPTLPYDASYLPLSPNNIDQLGHVLIPPTLSGQSTAKGTGDMYKHGRGNAANKKMLPGQDLQEHIVSQTPGHRAVPWGLQTTLKEQESGGKRARTKMGTLKRTALRDVNRRGKLTPTMLKMDLDNASETDSPLLPLIEISEVTTPADMPKQPPLIEIEEDSERQELKDVQADEDKAVSFPLGSEAVEIVQIAPPVQITNTIPKKRRRGRQSEVLALSSMSTSADESMLSGESSSQEAANNTKRPREAHKRLKLVGGYFRKPSRHRQEPEEVKVDDVVPANNGTNDSISRGTSFAPNDAAAPFNDDQVQVNGSQPDHTIGMSSSPPPSGDSGIKQVTINAPLAGSLRRMTTAAPLQTSPSKLMRASGEMAKADASDEGNNEFCETCQGVGHFICCDGCPRSFHFACINPPLDIDELPNSIGDASDTWYCNVCRSTGKGKKRDKGKRSGDFFAPLVRVVEEHNPNIFALPQDIRNYFKGVSTASDGSYINTSMLRPVKVNKFGVLEEREPLRLKDKNGKPILCFQCGESAMPSELALSSPSRNRERPVRQAAKAANAAVFSQSAGAASAEDKDSKTWRNIISCDFCSLHWHLDCLDPPMATMPSLSRKWMCPNHIEHVLPSERIPKSVANSTSVHELPLPSKETIGPGKHYRMRVVNDGQIDIIPDPMDTYTGPAHDTGSTAIDGTIISSNIGPKSSSSGSGAKGWQELVLPAYKGYPTVFGSQNNVKFKYRIPEKVIRLDFWSKVELQREKLAEAVLRQEHKSRKDGLDLLAVVANAASLEQHEEVQSLPQSAHPKAMTKSEAKDVVETIFADYPYVEPGQEPISLLRQSYGASDEEDEEPMQGVVSAISSGSSSSSLSSAPTPPDSLHKKGDSELAKLRSIQQLIAYKGKDALLRFLLEE